MLLLRRLGEQHRALKPPSKVKSRARDQTQRHCESGRHENYCLQTISIRVLEISKAPEH
jgi:hypothetical protein